MHAHLKLAYAIGAETAKEHFKTAAGADIATPIAGALGPWPAALAGGLSSPEGRGFAGGAGAGGGALLGQVAGGLGGAGLGALGGAGVAKLYNARYKSGAAFRDRLVDYRHMDSEKATAAGAGLGALLGGLGGGAYGAYKGRRAGVGEEGQDTENKEGSAKFARAPHDASDAASAALGGVPIIGPAAAGLASGMSGPRGLRQTTGMATTGGAAAGQALGGMGGAALGAGLGAGGAALYNQFRDKSLMEKLFGGGDVDVGRAAGIGALAGGGAGVVGGGILGAHQGRGYGEDRAERRDAIKAQILQAMRQRRQQMMEHPSLRSF